MPGRTKYNTQQLIRSLHLQLGDWFVLYQLCKNCNPYFFREFIKELARELKRKPKETKKTSKDSSNGNGEETNFSTDKLF